MAEKIVIELDVRDGELEQLNSELERTEQSFRDVQKATDGTNNKVQELGKKGGFIATLDRFTNGWASQIRDAGEALVGVNSTLKGTRSALIATGVGAFVVVLGTIVAYWSDIKDFISGANRELDRHIDLLNEQAGLADHELAVLDAKEEALKAQGKTQREINEARKQELERIIALRTEELELSKQRLESLEQLEKQGGKSLEQFARVTLAITNSLAGSIDNFLSKFGLDTGFQESAVGVSETILDKVFGTKEKIDEQRSAIQDLELSLASAQSRLAGLNASGGGGSAGGVQTAQVSSVGNLSPEGATRVLQQDALGEALLESARRTNGLLLDEERNRLMAELALTEGVNAQKLALTQDTIGKMTQILGENTVAGKVAGAAQALINAYLGVTQVWSNKTTLPEPLGTINKIASSALALKSGLSAVRAINQTKIPNLAGFSGGGGGGASIASISQPSFNVVGDTGVNQIADAIGRQTDQPVRAYITTEDVESNEQLRQNTIGNVALG